MHPNDPQMPDIVKEINSKDAAAVMQTWIDDPSTDRDIIGAVNMVTEFWQQLSGLNLLGPPGMISSTAASREKCERIVQGCKESGIQVALTYSICAAAPAEIANTVKHRGRRPDEGEIYMNTLRTWSVAVEMHARALILKEWPTANFHREAVVQVLVSFPAPGWMTPEQRTFAYAAMEAGAIGVGKNRGRGQCDA
jgi:hypothetical protein